MLRGLVETRLELHRHRHLFAVFGGLDQRGDDRRVALRAVQGLLDRQHLGIPGGDLDEALDTRRKRIVGMVDHQVPARDFGEEVHRFAVRGRREAWMGRRPEGRIAQLGNRGRAKPAQPGEAQGRRHLVDLVVPDRQLLANDGPHPRRHLIGDLEAHDAGKAQLAQFLLDRLQEVVGGVVVDLEVGAAGDPERVGLEDLGAGEQPLEVMRDHVFEGQETERLRQMNPPRQLVRDLHPAEASLTRHRMAQRDAEGQAEVGDERERVRRIDRDRSQDRKHRLVEELVQPSALGDLEVVPAQQVKPRLHRAPGATPRRRPGAARRPAGAPAPRSPPVAGAACGPSGDTSRRLEATCCFRPPIRFMKNSSRFEPKMETNLSRSRSGFEGSRASARTRSLKSSQESSRLR